MTDCAVLFLKQYKSSINIDHNAYFIDNLLNDIDEKLNLMRDILKGINNENAIELKREFSDLTEYINIKIIKIKQQIDDDISMQDKYKICINQKSDCLQCIIQNAMKQFSKFGPQVTSTEISPLLQVRYEGQRVDSNINNNHRTTERRNMILLLLLLLFSLTALIAAVWTFDRSL